MKLRYVISCLGVVLALTACDRTVTTVEETSEPANCFTCHSDQDTKLVAAEQQYDYSVHASGTVVSELNEPCNGCHTSEGFVHRIETGEILDTVANPSAINCFTCHAPHTNGNMDRRLEAPFPLANGVSFDHHDGNMCTACHQSRRNVDTYVTTPTGRVNLTSRFGPHHGPQTDMLTGTNGYEYAGFTYEQTNHKTALEDGCLDCHMKETENLRVGGHSFNMTYDQAGDILMNTAACAKCHGNVSDFDVAGQQTVTDSLVTDLRTRLVAAGLVSGSTGLPRTASTSSDSAGAVWNYMLAVEDRSHGVHNRKYIQSLLISAIDYISGGPIPVASK